jgi:hypothetical protein
MFERALVDEPRPCAMKMLGVETTSAHRNIDLSMSLQRAGFADRDEIPRIALGSGVRVQ